MPSPRPPALPKSPADRRRDDLHQLRLLAVFHWVAAVFALLGIVFLGLHFTLMNTVFGNPDLLKDANTEAQVEQAMSFFKAFRWFYAFGAVIFGLGAVGNLVSGFLLHRRTHRVASVVIAGLNCLFFPVGTVLGVFTLVVLLRDSVMALYAEKAAQVPQNVT